MAPSGQCVHHRHQRGYFGAVAVSVALRAGQSRLDRDELSPCCRYKGRHLWNPSNFGLSAVLFLAPATVSLLSIQWGNNIWPMVVIWTLGSVIVWRVGRLHISAAYVASFLLLSYVQSVVTGNPWLAIVAPITGPMYQLFIFFMVTDPKTTVHSKRGQVLVVFCVALMEMLLRLNEVVYAPFYALFLVGPASRCSSKRTGYVRCKAVASRLRCRTGSGLAA